MSPDGGTGEVFKRCWDVHLLHNNKVGVVFTEHTRVAVFFVEVDEHEYMSVLLVTHDVIVDFDELFLTHLTRHLLSY